MSADSRSCSIIPVYPADLDPAGGEIADGTEDVVVECYCNGFKPIRWFNPNATRLFRRPKTPPGDPYYTTAQHSKLIIPRFDYSTSGTYLCGIDRYYPPPGLVTVNLFLPTGKACVYVCSYVRVVCV